MSRLSEAETKFAAAIEALEVAINARLDAAAVAAAENGPAENGPGGNQSMVDAAHREAMIAELANIDAQVSRAIRLISDANRNVAGRGQLGEGGTA